MADLKQLEMLCQALYGGQQAHQNEAHKVLMPLLRDVQKIPVLYEILANSTNLQSLLFASSGLITLFTNHWSQITEQSKKEMREFLLNYLYNRGPEMLKVAPEVLRQFIHLYSRIVKLGWLEEINNQQLINHVSQFLSASTQHWIIGLNIYTDLTQEMQPQMGKFIAKYRRGALNFKETVLQDIFTVTIQTLEQFNKGTMVVNDLKEESQLLYQILQLCYNCLSFDFMATMPDDTSEEQATVMIPQGWDMLRTDEVPKLLFQLYHKSLGKATINTPTNASYFGMEGKFMSCCTLSLRCLVVLAAIRKSFFNNENEALGHINCFMLGSLDIIRNKMGLSNDDCYHELCRLLGKINAANQLSQLLQSNVFPIWSEQLYNFTLEALANWTHMTNSKHYLLGVWAHMIVPLGYMKGKAPTVLESNILQITLEFLNTRLKMAHLLVTNPGELDFENPLDDDVLRNEQSDLFSRLCRNQYRVVLNHMMELFTNLNNNLANEDMLVVQEKLSWLVLFSGAMLNGSSSLRLVGDEKTTAGCIQTLNIELVGRVFQNIANSDKMAENVHLELSYLSFLGHFRKFYISEHTKGTISGDNKERFAQLPNLPPGVDGSQYLLNRMIEKVFYNLQNRTSDERVVKKTLQFFSDLSSGIDIVHYADRSPHLIVSARLILQCETLRFALLNHHDASFKFLFTPSYGRYRTIYYAILTKLLLLEIADEQDANDKFNIYMQYHNNLIDQANNFFNANASAGSPTAVASNAEFKGVIVGFMRDLRGICKSCVSVESYQLFFNWIINTPKQINNCRFNILKRVCELCYNDYQVMLPLIKFLAELLDNKGRRITFDKTSANGLLLFKESSYIVIYYGLKLLDQLNALKSGSPNSLGYPVGTLVGGVNSETEIYKKYYKSISYCLLVLVHTLGGDYISFGVFDIYGDNTLDQVLNLSFQLILAIPLDDLQSYPKSMQPVYSFLDLATKLFIDQMLAMESSNVSRLLNIGIEGLCSYDSSISLSSASLLDNFVTYIYNNKTKEQSLKFLSLENSILVKCMVLMFNLLTRGDSNSAWSISRPLLGLILLNKSEFQNIPHSYMANLSQQKGEKLLKCFNNLMLGIEDVLTPENKDLFTKNVYLFSQEVKLSFV
ncbi:Ran-binding protein [Theileria orientalis]|uniref:Ran-binding protein n=1 Tax=Theileria orientalis TaxID=68886 RepID=A0A976ME24_THEOR|nr:Ran-binding protein [Theileria orientalis]